MKIFKSKLLLFILLELIVFVALVYWYTTSNTYTITEKEIVNPDTGETKTVLYRLNKRTGKYGSLAQISP